MSLSFIWAENEKVEQIKIYKLITLRFLVENDVNTLCDWTQVSLVLYLPIKLLVNLT